MQSKMGRLCLKIFAFKMKNRQEGPKLKLKGSIRNFQEKKKRLFTIYSIYVLYMFLAVVLNTRCKYRIFTVKF